MLILFWTHKYMACSPPKRTVMEGSYVPMKKGAAKSSKLQISGHVCALSIPITLANITHLQTAQLEHSKVPVPPHYTRSLSVFLAWRVQKSLALGAHSKLWHVQSHHILFQSPRLLSNMQKTMKLLYLFILFLKTCPEKMSRDTQHKW